MSHTLVIRKPFICSLVQYFVYLIIDIMYHTSLISSSGLFIFSVLVIMLHTFRAAMLICVCAHARVCASA